MGPWQYVAPDWTADWLHRKAMFILDRWSAMSDGYAGLPTERRAALPESPATAHAGEYELESASSGT